MKNKLILILAVLFLFTSGFAMSSDMTPSTTTIPQIPITGDWGIDEGDSVEGYD